MTTRRSALRLLLSARGVAMAAAPASAQGLVRVVGTIQWASGTRMQVMTDGGASVAVDLMEAEQSDYRGLRPGDVVLVDGVMSPDRRRVIAREVWRDNGRGAWTQSP